MTNQPINQDMFYEPLTEFEQATLEQLVSYRARDDEHISKLLKCTKLQEQAKQMVFRWNNKRIELGLKAFS